MAEITNLTANGKLAEDWQTINNNFENLNTGKAEASTTYTKTEVDNAVGGKVSKSGDTMSGGITYSTSAPMKRNVDDSTLLLFGGTAYDKGAYLELRGGANSTEAGKAYLWGRSGSQGAALSVSPDGTTSAPTPAVTDNSTKIATTAFVNNRIQSGSTTISVNNTSGTTVITLPRPMPNANYSVSCILGYHSQWSYTSLILSAKTNTTFTIGHFNNNLVNATSVTLYYTVVLN